MHSNFYEESKNVSKKSILQCLFSISVSREGLHYTLFINENNIRSIPNKTTTYDDGPTQQKWVVFSCGWKQIPYYKTNQRICMCMHFIRCVWLFFIGHFMWYWVWHVTILIQDKLNLTTQLTSIFNTTTCCMDFVGFTQPCSHYKFHHYQYSLIINYRANNSSFISLWLSHMLKTDTAQ